MDKKASHKRMDDVIVKAAKRMAAAIKKSWPTMNEDIEACTGQNKFLMTPLRRRKPKRSQGRSK